MYVITIKGEIGVDFKREDLLMHINKSGNDSIHLDIDSIGGYVEEADKMITDLEATNRVVSSSNSGDVASAAVGIFLVAPDRTFYKNKGSFLIHNPYGGVEGDSSKLEKASVYLKGLENKYAQMYSRKTNANLDVIKGFMSENKPLTNEQVSELGFAKVEELELRAVARFNINNKNKMDKLEMEQKFDAMEKSLLSQIKGLFKTKPKSLMITDADGNELNMPDIEDASQIAVGVKIDAADGSYVQADGSTIVVMGGEISEIIEVVEAVIDEEKEALIQKVAELEAELAVYKKEVEDVKVEAKATLENVQKEFKTLKAKMSGFKPATATPTEKDEKVKKSFNYKKY